MQELPLTIKVDESGDTTSPAPASRSEADAIPVVATTALTPPMYTKTTTIRWKSVEIREHPIIIGDNPSVMKGVPITIDWIPTACVCLDLDAYEDQKERRHINQIIMNAADREELLMNGHRKYNRSALLRAQRQASIDRNNRRLTNQAKRWDSVHERMETISHTLQRLLGVRQSKQSERAFFELYRGAATSTVTKGARKVATEYKSERDTVQSAQGDSTHRHEMNDVASVANTNLSSSTNTTTSSSPSIFFLSDVGATTLSLDS
jgi:hypothetical protein